MGHVHGGDAELALHFLEFAAQLHAQLGVQVGKRLVQADDLGVVDQGAGDGHALLLAAGELRHLAGQLLLGQVHLRGHFLHPAVDVGLVHLFDPHTKGDVLIHAHGGEQGVVLEHHADVALFHGHVGNILALHRHGAQRGLNKAGDGAQRGGFAAAGGPQEGVKFALFHVNVDILQRRKVAKAHFNAVQSNHCGGLHP